MSDQALTLKLLASFDKYVDPFEKGFYHTELVEKSREEVHGLTVEGSPLADAILCRPYIMNQLDIDAHGRLDGEIDRHNIQHVIGAKGLITFRSLE
ncbi:hypothetical protein BLL37_03300 [Pseudomonas azotoformans]|uniref:Uncharacterized protein n=1 Tax=Pseudomonas azotoformans TaxID=47878 RepID=A0A1V2JTA5_PSEAZ|nr:hypothetical protein [Pseudomonas azotoformans]OIN49093.1 hypothetical protein BFL39_10265 [Pseudomonas azotoformans]ONH48400.1 hypothetical protein BLL37_03300 [Pseudomonas azotoformans]